jgi:hypothetical protein
MKNKSYIPHMMGVGMATIIKQFTRYSTPIFTGTLTVLFSAACIGDWPVIEDGEEGDTGAEGGGILDEGVYINCLNENNLNYWWVFAAGPTIQQKFGGPGEYLNGCIGPANMGAGFNLVDDWDEQAYGYPSFGAEIRALCSERCMLAHKVQTGQTAVCEDANWSGHAVIAPAYDPAVNGSNCKVSEVNPFIIDDPDASEIDWNEGTGIPLSLPLNCSLLSDCSDEFDADIDEWTLAFNAGGASGPIDPDTREASYHSVTAITGTSIALDMNSGDGSGYDDENPLDGHAEYSPSYCGSSTCPFYLAAFEAGNTTDEWTIHLDVPRVVSEHKEISNVQIDLLQSTLAVWRPSTGRVAFPPGSLVFQLDFELSSDTCTGACCPAPVEIGQHPVRSSGEPPCPPRPTSAATTPPSRRPRSSAVIS